jgi:hypothetical protein
VTQLWEKMSFTIVMADLWQPFHCQVQDKTSREKGEMKESQRNRVQVLISLPYLWDFSDM